MTSRVRACRPRLARRLAERPRPDLLAVAAPGHTPGHVALHVISGRELLLHAVDVFHYPAFDLNNPEWATALDADVSQATRTRRRLLDEAAADRVVLTAYHMPGGELGRVSRRGSGYAWEPGV